ncbi:MAG TPA: hypothetical protein VD908_05905 [Cytophagales bacterium]|nr:hypothetical protein [Cytophagales bacterium]
MKEYKAGTTVEHPRYGDGVIYKVNLTNYEIIFERGGKIQFSKSNEDLIIKEAVEVEGTQTGLDLAKIEEVITYVLEKHEVLIENVPLGEKWSGGTLILQPSSSSLKPKEIPIETFFHKIVMVRDRLRVLEQNINSHSKLTDEDKVNLQQYITRIYGSLTTFNILFKEKDHYFAGAGEKG